MDTFTVNINGSSSQDGEGSSRPANNSSNIDIDIEQQQEQNQQQQQPNDGDDGDGSSDSDNSNDDDGSVTVDRELVIEHLGTSDQNASYSITFSADSVIEYGDDADEGVTDEINGRYVTGGVSGGSDDFRFGGEIEDIEYGGCLRFLVDGDEIEEGGDCGDSNPDDGPDDPEDLDHHLVIEPLDDDPGRYTLYFDAGKPVMYGEEADDEDGSDVISGAYASGTINRGTDDYYYNGGVSIRYTGNLRFTVDGEVIEENPVEPSGRDLLIEPGDGYSGSEATYSVVFRSGTEVAYGEEADDEDGTDRLYDDELYGTINGGSDNYRFSGSIESITHTGDLRFVVDGTEVDDALVKRSDDTYDNELEIEYADGGSGEGSYVIETSTSRIHVGPDADIEDGSDRIDGRVIRGTINSGSDDYLFDGSLESIRYRGDLRFTVNGTAVDASLLTRIDDSYDHELVVEYVDGSSGRGSYTADVTTTAIEYGEAADNEDGSDRIDGREIAGTINSGSDNYFFDGSVSAISYSGPLRFSVDGEAVNDTLLDRVDDTYDSELIVEYVENGSEEGNYTIETDTSAIGYGEEADNEDGSDRIDGNVIRGSINSGSDNYFLDGSVTDISYTGYLRFLLDDAVLREDTPRSDADTTTETEAPDTETETTTEDPDTETERITDDGTETTTEPTTEGPDTETATAAPDTDTTTEMDTDTPTRTRSDTPTPTPTETETGTDSDEGSGSGSDAGSDDEQSAESTDES